MKRTTLASTDLILLNIARYVARGESVTDHRGEFARTSSGVAHCNCWSRYIGSGLCGSGAVQSGVSSIASAVTWCNGNSKCVHLWQRKLHEFSAIINTRDIFLHWNFNRILRNKLLATEFANKILPPLKIHCLNEKKMTHLLCKQIPLSNTVKLI